MFKGHFFREIFMKNKLLIVCIFQILFIKENSDSGRYDICQKYIKLSFSDLFYADNESEKLQSFILNKV